MRNVNVGLIILLLAVVVGGQSKWGAQPGPIVLSWSVANEGPLFVADAQPKSKDGLIYDGGEFTLRLSDVLTYDHKFDSFSLWMGLKSGEQLVMLNRSAGSYRGKVPGRGDYFGLNDLGKLKLLWLASGERFLFTEINGVWHCVMLEDPRGRKLYVDYDREGAIVLVRDGVRTVELVYQNGQLDSVYQSWPSKTGGRELAKTNGLR